MTMIQAGKSTHSLEAVLMAAAPYVTAARAAGAPSAPGVWPSVRIFLSPFRVEVAFNDVGGRTLRRWTSQGDPTIAELTSAFLNASLLVLPDLIRTRVTRLIEARAAELLVLVDVEVGVAGVAIMSDNGEPELLTVLRPAESVH